MLHETEDILYILRKCDENKWQLPKFVVDSYDGLPPTSGFELIAQSLTSLNEEIVSSKKEIEHLKERRIEQDLASQDMTRIKEDLITIRGELRKINHSALQENVRRDSLLLDNLHNIRCNSEFINEASSTAEAEVDCVNNSTKNENNRSLSRSSTIITPNAPYLTSDDLLEAANRSFQDDGGSPSAPTFSQVVGNNDLQEDIMPVQQDSIIDIPRRPAIKSSRLMGTQNRGSHDKHTASVDEEGFTLVQNRKEDS